MLLWSDVKEIRRRMEPDNCGISRIRGAYVADGSVLAQINAPFLALPENEFYKYLDIAKACLTKKIGDQMLSLEIEENSVVRTELERCIASGLKDDDAVQNVFDRIMDILPPYEKYLLLMIQENYDIPRYGADGADQDESEEVYAYVMCIIIPVKLDKSGLYYDGEKIASKKREWVASKPTAAFVYPSWEERTVEHDRCMFYTAAPDKPPHELMEKMLNAKQTQTATEIRMEFEELINRHAESTDAAEEYIASVNEVLDRVLNVTPKLNVGAPELGCILADTEISKDNKAVIIEEYRKMIKSAPAEWLFNPKALKKAEEIKKRRELNKLMFAAADAIRHPNIDEEYAEKLAEKLIRTAGGKEND